MMLILHNAFVYMFSFFFLRSLLHKQSARVLRRINRFYSVRRRRSVRLAICIRSKHFHTHEHFLPSHLFESVLRSVLFILVHKGDGIFSPSFLFYYLRKSTSAVHARTSITTTSASTPI